VWKKWLFKVQNMKRGKLQMTAYIKLYTFLPDSRIFVCGRLS